MPNVDFVTIPTGELSSANGGWDLGFGAVSDWYQRFKASGTQHPRELDPERMAKFRAGQEANRRSLLGGGSNASGTEHPRDLDPVRSANFRAGQAANRQSLLGGGL